LAVRCIVQKSRQSSNLEVKQNLVKGQGHQKGQSSAFLGTVLVGTVLGALCAVCVWGNIFSIAGVAGVPVGHATASACRPTPVGKSAHAVWFTTKVALTPTLMTRVIARSACCFFCRSMIGSQWDIAHVHVVKFAYDVRIEKCRYLVEIKVGQLTFADHMAYAS